MEAKYPDVKVTLIEGKGGAFEVKRDGSFIFSKKKLGRFPEHEEIFSKFNEEKGVIVIVEDKKIFTSATHIKERPEPGPVNLLFFIDFTKNDFLPNLEALQACFDQWRLSGSGNAA